MEKKYKLVETKADEKWDKFIEESKNGTVFLNSVYLKASAVRYKLFYFYNNQELRAAIGVVEDEKGESVILDDLIIYNGIMYNKPTNKQNLSQQHSEQFKIQEFIANELIKRYKNIELSLHPSIIDIRPFLWVNYGTNLSKFKVNLRYTSYINISDFRNAATLEEISIYNNASVARRQQIRYAIKKGYKTEIVNNPALFVDFYKKTMNRQGIEVERKKLERMENVMESLINEGIGKIYGSYDENKELGSLAFFGWDNKRAYYIFGANDPVKRKGHTGTNVLWEAFYDLSKMGINEVDLEGINSPYRGWFKLSFGGNIMPYYELNYKQSEG
jgi:hypothetical protein